MTEPDPLRRLSEHVPVPSTAMQWISYAMAVGIPLSIAIILWSRVAGLW